MHLNLKLIPSKLWAAQGLVVILVFAGCTPAPVVEPPMPQEQMLPVEPAPDTKTYHTVKQGETLYGISRRYGRNYKEVALWNNILPPYELNPGQRLRIDGPNEEAMQMPSVPDEPGIPVDTPTLPTPMPITPPSDESPMKEAGLHLVQPGETLYGIATQYNQNFRDLAVWNNIEPPYHLNVGQTLRVTAPSGSVPIPSKTPELPSMLEPQAPKQDSGKYHVVLPGETLYHIARSYGLSFKEVADWNGLQPPYGLSVGQKLQVTAPVGGLPTPSSPSISPSPKLFDDSAESDEYIVAPGDTLFQIARHYNLNWKDLAKWNNLQPPYSLSVGQKLRVTQPTTHQMIPGTTAPDSGNFRPVGLRPSHHIVKTGETLRGIAQSYGITVEELARWNGIGSPYTVYPGLRLRMNP